MRKWISGIDHMKGQISTLRVSDGAGWQDMSRIAVIDEINSRNHDYWIWYYDPVRGKHIEGPQVRSIEVQDSCYLRTDETRIASDNLDSLSSMCPFRVGQYQAGRH